MEEKQIFTTFDSISVLGLLSAVILIIATILSSGMYDQKSGKALARAQQLAAQILIGGYKASLAEDPEGYESGTRHIASLKKMDIKPVGRIGMDPWGSPYYYRIFTGKNDTMKVIVVSSGPNRQLNMTEDYFNSDSMSDMPQIDFRGDDIGSIKSSL